MVTLLRSGGVVDRERALSPHLRDLLLITGSDDQFGDSALGGGQRQIGRTRVSQPPPAGESLAFADGAVPGEFCPSQRFEGARLVADTGGHSVDDLTRTEPNEFRAYGAAAS